jgi:hypothetical protein
MAVIIMRQRLRAVVRRPRVEQQLQLLAKVVQQRQHRRLRLRQPEELRKLG